MKLRTALLALGVIAMGALNLIAFRLPWIADLTGSQRGLALRLSLASLVIAAVQSAVLYGVYRRFAIAGGRAPLKIALLAAIAISACAAFLLPPQSNDVYAYAGYGKLDSVRATYAPPATPLPPAFRAVNRIWGRPLIPSVYGPLWAAYNRAVTGSARTIGDAVLRVRIANVVWLALIVLLMYRLRVPAGALWLFAANPLVWSAFVLSAHNDVIPLAFACAALLAVTAGAPIAGVALVAAAGLTKITFALIALTAFAPLPRRRQRLVLAGASIAIVAIGSAIAGGVPYARAFAAVAHAYARELHPAGTAIHYALAATSIIAVAAALIARRWIGAGAWTFVALGVNYFSWYAAWGIPYALASQRFLAAYLIALPLAGAAIFAPVTLLFSAPAMAVACIIWAVAEARSRRPTRRAMTLRLRDV